RHGGAAWPCDRRGGPMRSAVIVEPPRSERYLDPLGPLGLQWASTRLGVDPLRAFQPARASQARRGVRTAVVTKNSSPVKDEVVTSARPVMLTLGEGRHGCALCGYGSHEASTDLVGRIRQPEQHNRCLHPFHAKIRQNPRLRTAWMAYSPDL